MSVPQRTNTDWSLKIRGISTVIATFVAALGLGSTLVSRVLTSGRDPRPIFAWIATLIALMLAAQTGDMGEESGRRFAQHLLRVHGGKTIRLEWIYHKLLSPQQVASEQQSDAASNYVVLATIQETAREPSGNEAPVSIPGARR